LKYDENKNILLDSSWACHGNQGGSLECSHWWATQHRQWMLYPAN
jgi:hypothetical protein